MSIPFISVFQTNICIHKPFPLRIINPTPQIIQSRLLIVHIPTIAERIQRTNRRCQTAGFTDRITPRIINIFYHLRTIRVNRRNHIALQIVDFYHSAYKRLYMPFRGIKWSSLFLAKKKRPSISRKSLSWLIPPRLIQYEKTKVGFSLIVGG